MTPMPSLFHTLLRPCVLQILRAQGYHATRTTVVDALTDLATRYMYALCRSTAQHMAHNGSETGPTVVDVRMALQDCGAFLPEEVFEEQEWVGEEDVSGVEEFIRWFQAARAKEITRVAMDGDDENTDYLMALKKRHSKAEDDTKYSGTVLGRGTEHGDVVVEGGDATSIRQWEDRLKRERQLSPVTLPQSPEEDSRPPSSGLSSLGDRTIGEDMDLS